MRVRFVELTGAFVNLDPQGKVVVSVYSSGAIGRLVPDDLAGLVATSASTPRPRPEDRESRRPQAVSRARSG
jgi:hypothetical protein